MYNKIMIMITSALPISSVQPRLHSESGLDPLLKAVPICLCLLISLCCSLQTHSLRISPVPWKLKIHELTLRQHLTSPWQAWPGRVLIKLPPDHGLLLVPLLLGHGLGPSPPLLRQLFVPQSRCLIQLGDLHSHSSHSNSYCYHYCSNHYLSIFSSSFD